MIPVTADYLKREFFVQQVAQKDRTELAERRNVVQKIINEKKQHVSFEQVMRYLFKLNLDRPIKNQRDFLPITF